jgi:hypothetical protein
MKQLIHALPPTLVPKLERTAPQLLIAADAWTYRAQPVRFYTIHWRGEQPVCFTPIEFQLQISDLFKVRIKHGWPDGVYYLKATDRVLMFDDHA